MSVTSSLKCVDPGLSCVLRQIVGELEGEAGMCLLSCAILSSSSSYPLPGPLISCAKHLNLPGSAHQSSSFTSVLITAAAAPGGRHDTSASKSSIRRFVITEKAPTIRAFSWLKAATTAFTFKTLLRHYAKQAPKHMVSRCDIGMPT